VLCGVVSNILAYVFLSGARGHAEFVQPHFWQNGDRFLYTGQFADHTDPDPMAMGSIDRLHPIKPVHGPNAPHYKSPCQQSTIEPLPSPMVHVKTWKRLYKRRLLERLNPFPVTLKDLVVMLLKVGFINIEIQGRFNSLLEHLVHRFHEKRNHDRRAGNR